MTETTNDTETFTVSLTTPTSTVTCDRRCPKFDGTGCDLLNHYDLNSNGVIDAEDVIQSRDHDYPDGLITYEEAMFVFNALYKSIDDICPGCYTPSESNNNTTYLIIAIAIALLALLLRG